MPFRNARNYVYTGICQSDADQIDNQKDEFEKTGDTRHA